MIIFLLQPLPPDGTDASFGHPAGDQSDCKVSGSCIRRLDMHWLAIFPWQVAGKSLCRSVPASWNYPKLLEKTMIFQWGNVEATKRHSWPEGLWQRPLGSLGLDSLIFAESLCLKTDLFAWGLAASVLALPAEEGLRLEAFCMGGCHFVGQEESGHEHGQHGHESHEHGHQSHSHSHSLALNGFWIWRFGCMSTWCFFGHRSFQNACGSGDGHCDDCGEVWDCWKGKWSRFCGQWPAIVSNRLASVFLGRTREAPGCSRHRKCAVAWGGDGCPCHLCQMKWKSWKKWHAGGCFIRSRQGVLLESYVQKCPCRCVCQRFAPGLLMSYGR